MENNLLYSSEIASKENYNGIFVVDEKKGSDYKVVLELSPTEQFVFYFTRSDKDEILNPWKDKSHSRHSFVAGISPLLNHGSAYWLWSRAKWFGFYSGIVFQYESSDIEVLDYVSFYELSEPRYLHVDGLNSSYDWKFDYDESTIKSDSFGFYIGVTLKTFPYTWLLLGCGFDFVSNECFEGDLYYRCSSNNENYKKYGRCCLAVDYDIFVTPQVRVNFITNHLDIGAMTYFSYGDYAKGKFNIDILLGIAL